MSKKEFELVKTSDIADYLGKWVWDSLALEEAKLDIDALMEFLGKLCKCERTYIFEIDYVKRTFSNTYEWCAQGVDSQKELLQNEDLDTINVWIEAFDNNESVVISNIDEIKESTPWIYAVLKPQGIHSLVAEPIYCREKLVGFLGIDNPEVFEFGEITNVLSRVALLFTYLLEHKKLEERVQYNKYHDQLTRSLNKNALDREFLNAASWNTLGIVSCDLSELKFTNEELGFIEGDVMICRCNEIIKEIFVSYDTYRISGDRFVVICPNIKEAYFDDLVTQLEKAAAANDCCMLCGSVWSNEKPINPDALLDEAEKVLHKNKAIYFCQTDPKFGKTRNRRITSLESFLDSVNDSHASMLYRFIENNYFSFDLFFKSMEMGGNFPYFGDLQKNAWFISDNIKETWGFDKNIIHDFVHKWKRNIPHEEDAELYERSIAEVFRFKKEAYDLIYRVVDKNGEELWVRAFGYIRWDENKEIPLFFCGHIVKVNHDFDADSITNFKREKVAIRDIGSLLYDKRKAQCLCFRLSGFGEINELRGRDTGNNLLKDIGASLSREFENTAQFYRLDGLRFLTIIMDEEDGNVAEISKKIKNIISDLYVAYNIPIRYPCAVGILGEIKENVSPIELLTDVSSVLDIAKTKPETDTIYSVGTLTLHRAQKHMGLELSKDVVNGMNNFRVVVQPIVSSTTHKVVGGEVLLRWKYLNQEVSPMVFVPILEDNDLMPAVGKWVFEQAVKLCKRLNSYDPNFFLDFNVSYHQIKDETLLAYMENIMSEYNITSSRLVMELTETHYNDDPIKLQKFINSCKTMGMKIALDDFGVGYSSLEMLLKYPAHVVKLDRSLMKKMSCSSDSNIFISTIVSACHNFNKLVCVEGVETETELKMVTQAGCDTIQGFYFYKPMEVIDVYDLVIKDNS